MYLVRLMWRSASESKPVHSRYSRLSQAWRTAKPIGIISAVSNWFRRRTWHELNSLNSIRLMWSTASEPGLSLFALIQAPAFFRAGVLKSRKSQQSSTGKKTVALPLTTIPCEPHTANKVHGLSHIFVIFVNVNIVYARFEDFELFCTLLWGLLQFLRENNFLHGRLE